MANVSRLTVIWGGFAGAPGYSKFSFMPLPDDTARNAAGAALRTFLVAVAAYIPNGTTLDIQPMVDDLDTVSGELRASSAMTTVPTRVTSTATSNPFAGGSGFLIRWNAGGVFNNRRIQGRTYVVPSVSVYQADGTIGASIVSAIQTAGAALIATAGADLAVWNRQYSNATPPVPIAGNLSSATSCSVRSMATQLRSRRQ
jgi:hypothetical protein